jgi:hypothetical protein
MEVCHLYSCKIMGDIMSKYSSISVKFLANKTTGPEVHLSVNFNVLRTFTVVFYHAFAYLIDFIMFLLQIIF